MWDLFAKFLGYIFSLTVLYSLIALGHKVSESNKKGFLKTKKIKGYYTASSDEMTAVMFVLSVLGLIMLSIFVFCNYLGITDENGNNLIPHIIIVLIPFILCFSLFLYGKRRKIYFNKKELIIYPLLRKHISCSYEEINKVIYSKNRGIVLYTTKGRYVFDEYYSNKDKFIKILEEKNTEIIHTNYFYKK